jgi:hypothetical protein
MAFVFLILPRLYVLNTWMLQLQQVYIALARHPLVQQGR